MSKSTIFQLCWDMYSLVEPVLRKHKCVLLKDHNTVTGEAPTRAPSVLSQVSPDHNHLACWSGSKPFSKEGIELGCEGIKIPLVRS